MEQTRRRLLAAVGAMGPISLAGCSSVLTDQTGKPTGSDTDEVHTTAETTRLTPPDPSGGDRFGTSVDISEDGTSAIVGASKAVPSTRDENGVAYVFERVDGDWTQRATLTRSGDESKDDMDHDFGRAVAIGSEGEMAVVGTALEEDSRGEGVGTVYVFDDSSGEWTQRAKLRPNDGDPWDHFGFAVGVTTDGTRVVVGAEEDKNQNGMFAGSAYVFDVSDGTWSQEAKLPADDGAENDRLGGAVAVSDDGTTAIVGAVGDDSSAVEDIGSAYVFDGSAEEWTQRAKLTPADGESRDRFGDTVGIAGDGRTAVVGANQDDREENYVGSGFVFGAGTREWRDRTHLAPDDIDGGDKFGSAVAMGSDGTTAVVSALVDEIPNGNRAGSAYVFTTSNGEWRTQRKLVPSDGTRRDEFGVSVGLADDTGTIIVGAPGAGRKNRESEGAVYVFE